MANTIIIIALVIIVIVQTLINIYMIARLENLRIYLSVIGKTLAKVTAELKIE